MKIITVRMDEALHERVKEAAIADHRSVNTEVVTLLEEALKDRE